MAGHQLDRAIGKHSRGDWNLLTTADFRPALLIGIGLGLQLVHHSAGTRQGLGLAGLGFFPGFLEIELLILTEEGIEAALLLQFDLQFSHLQVVRIVQVLQ